MVVAGHHRAAEAGMAMLRAGGNAIDGAVATAATLAIAIPFMNGLGGDCICLYARSPGDIFAINGSGAVAKAASVAETRLPVFDFTHLVTMAHDACARRPFAGLL